MMNHESRVERGQWREVPGHSGSMDITNGGDGGEATPLKRNGAPSSRHRRKQDTLATGIAIGASVLAIFLCIWAVLFSSPGKMEDSKESSEQSHKDLFDSMGRFVLEDYDAQPTFSDFLPGVAGVYGKPVWSFYVNRGQGIASFGTESKDYPLMEFQSANKAYQDTPLLGFRTFIQGTRGARSFLVEPFSPLNTRFEHMTDVSSLPKRFMYVGSNEMQIREVDIVNRMEINVTYFTLPEEDFGALVRRITITNVDQQQPLNISMLDGLANIEPAGGKLNVLLKGMGRTLEGWMGVYQPYKETLTMPYFKLSTKPSDSASVTIEEAGHYCLSIIEGNPSTLLPIIYDASKVFGEDTMMLRAIKLQSKTVGEIIKETQYGSAKTPSAFAAVDNVIIGPNETLTISTFLGKAEQIMNVPLIARRIAQEGFSQYKLSRARELINQITASVETKTGHQLFNGHVQQMYLDNSLRGGIPIILGEVDDEARMSNADEDERLKVYHLFSRIHGDLERDYNDFVIDPTYFSQGPGNYRDVVQNRRSDVIFNPRIGSFNVKTFLSFIQPDGYEPLSVEAVAFSIKDQSICDQIAMVAVGHADGHRAQREALSGVLCSGPFRPGQLFLLMEEQNIFLMISRQEFIDEVAAAATSTPMAVYQTGFWADHWTYYMELIEAYLAIYPDGEERLMYDQELPYFYSPAFVQPRSKKYVLSVSFEGTGHHVRQLDATVADEEMLNVTSQYIDNSTNWYMIEANWTHDETGAIFKSSPIAKLFLLATVKYATRDAFGMGIEYEGGRPGWNDAMNGLVGMVGSGMPEAFELEVLIHYILSVVSKYERPLVIPIELAGLVESISAAMDNLEGFVDTLVPSKPDVPAELFEYWDAVSTAREEYRVSIKTGFSGQTSTLSPKTLVSTLQAWIKELDKGKARAFSFGSHGHGDDGLSGIPPTYFSYNVTKWTETGEKNKDGHPLVTPKQMKVGRFPLFLEGPARYIKTVDGGEAKTVYKRVRKSGLRDEGLSMYTVSASLQGQSYDMGRMMAFTPGWLENQSVWMHMSYKFYLELLKQDMFDEFFDEMTSGGILPFMRPDRYGRSLMECSSFIASSAFDDPSVRGRGFLARLSGSTAEFLSMWVLLMIGPRPFFLAEDTGELQMQLLPALPIWFFEKDTTEESRESDLLVVNFKLFGAITVYYHNVRRTDLYRLPPSRYKIGMRDGSIHTVNGTSIPGDLADKIRRVVFVDYISAFFE